MSGKGMERTCKIQAACCACFAAIQAVCISRSLHVVLLSAGADGTEAGLSAVLFPALLFGALLWCIRSWLFGVREESCRKERAAAVIVFGVLSAGSAAASVAMLALFIELCACLAAVGACRLFFSLEKAARQGRLMREELVRERLKKEQQQELAAANEEIRRLRHDMKNSYQLLLGLLQQGNAEEAMRFL